MPFELSLSPEEVSVQAGHQEEIAVQIRNLDAAEEQFTIEVLGLDASVFRIPEPSENVSAGQSARLSVALCPPAGGNIRAATYRFRIRATSAAREQHVVNASVTIEPALALKLELAPAGRTRFDVSVRSEANRDLDVELKAEDPRGTDPARSCDYQLESARVHLRQGESVRVPLHVLPRQRPLFGNGQTHPFTVSATPEIRNARSETVEGLARSAALIPWWLALLMLLALGGGAYTYTAMNRPQAPSTAPAPITQPRRPSSSRWPYGDDQIAKVGRERRGETVLGLRGEGGKVWKRGREL